MLKWTWLRIGRRIEWVTGGLFLLGLLLFGVIGLYSDNLLIGLFVGAFITLTILVPLLVLMLIRRRREARIDSVAPMLKRLSRVSLYFLLLGLTFVSATAQVSYGLASLAGSVLALYLWNLGLFIAIVCLNELLVRIRSNRLQREIHRTKTPSMGR
jgi:predicted Na+-dependent transporter